VTERPRTLIALCIIGWSAIALAVGSVILRSDLLAALPEAEAVGGTIALAGSAVALLGYWRMRRWGLWLILAVACARVIAGWLDLFPLRLTDLVWPAIIVVVGLYYYRRFS
jgi:hypothetical protein